MDGGIVVFAHAFGVLWDGAGAASPPHDNLEGTGRDLKGFAGGGGTGEELSVALVWL